MSPSRRSDRPSATRSHARLSRTVGLPNGADDIGNWWEPLGLASLFVEGLLAALAAAVLGEQAHAAAFGLQVRHIVVDRESLRSAA